MKAEERHRLHEHELQKLTRQAGDVWKKHGAKILAISAAVVVLAVGVTVWLVTAGSQDADAWAQMGRSASAGDYETIAEDYSGELVGHAARLQAAEQHLREGTLQAFSDRKAAIDEFQQGLAGFNALLEADDLPDFMEERALYGRARALESLAATADGEQAIKPEDVVAAYERLLAKYPETLFKELVEANVKSLKSQRTREFLAWFRSEQPAPTDRPTPDSPLPPSHPPLAAGPSLGRGPSLPPIPDRLQLPPDDFRPDDATGPSDEAPPFPPTTSDDGPVEAPRPAPSEE
ncbi:MAG: hypothetical protein KY476_24345 [Planctomycetes bacterium]|nr:hypothetical protein [Planctomycetota bacterium]